MRYLVIPDVHDKVDKVKSLLAHEKYDQVVFLGDFFDDWETDEEDARKTALCVREWLDQHIVLLGNHDVSYGWGHWNRDMLCSGFTVEKAITINSVLMWDDWKKFRLHYWADEWLLSHAGIHLHFLNRAGMLHSNQMTVQAKVDLLCANALKSLHDPVPAMRGRNCELLGAGYDRGGSQTVGGITWCDWKSLEKPVPVNQIVGHTQRPIVRRRPFRGKEMWCLDTRLQHYGILDNGKFSFKEWPVI